MLRVPFTQSNFQVLCDVEKFILNVSSNLVHDSENLIHAIMEFCDSDIINDAKVFGKMFDVSLT